MGAEVFANSATTTLSAAISDVGATSCTVADGAALPATGPYRISIDSEILRVTAGFGTTTLTITRGEEGTTAATHSNGASVKAQLTAAGVLNAPGWHNVKAYGALGDDSTDDTTNIHKARDAAGTWGTVFFPDGTYRAEGLDPLTGQTWILSKGATLKLNDGAATQLITPGVADFTLQDGILDGNKAGQTTPAFDAACLLADSSATRLAVKGVEVKNAYGTGIRLGGSDYAQILECNVHDNGSGAQTLGGIFCDTGTDYVLIAHNRLDANAGNGIKVKGDGSTLTSLAPRIIGNRLTGGITGTGSSGHLAIEVWGLAHQAIIANNFVQLGTDGQSQWGISADNSNSTEITGNIVYSDDAAATYNRMGVELAGVQNSSITGNTVDFTAPGTGGEDSCVSISNTPAGTGITVTGNAFRNANWGVKSVDPIDEVMIGLNSFYNIPRCVFSKNGTHVTVANNQMFRASGGGYCIEINSSSGNTAGPYNIFGNDVDGFDNFLTLVPNTGGTINPLTVAFNRGTNVTTFINQVAGGTHGPDYRFVHNDPNTDDTSFSHIGAATPSGGQTGDQFVGTGKIWVNDGGSWKSVAVA